MKTDPESLKHFINICSNEFNYLINEYNFINEDNPKGEFINPYQYRLTNGTITLIVEGINYGSNAIILLEDKKGRSISVNSLKPDWQPFHKQKRIKKSKQLNQDQQIILAAKELKEYGEDILKGNMERYIVIGDRMNSIMSHLK